MKIKKFSATWAGPFSELNLDLENMQGIWTVSGSDIDAPEEDYSNGVGKTSLYDSLAYALTGKSIEDRQVGEMVHDQASEKGSNKKHLTEVWVDNLRIRRGAKPKKFEVHRMDPDGSEREDLTSTASQEWLWEKWGINWDTLKFIMRFGGDENDLKSFAKANAETRRKIQDALIQADRISACLKTSRKTVNSIKQSSEVLVGRHSDAEDRVVSIQGEIEDLQDRLKKHESEVREEMKDIQSFIKRWKKFDFAEAYEIADDFVKVCEEISQLNNQAKNLQDQIDKQDDRINKLQDEIEELEAKKNRLAKKIIDESALERDEERAYTRFQNARQEYERSQGERDKRAPLEKDLAEAEKAVGKYESEIERLEQDLAKYQDLKPSVDTTQIEERIARLRDEIEETQEVIDKAKLKIKSLSDKKTPTVFEAELKAAKKEQTGIQNLIAEIEETIKRTSCVEEGMDCTTCGQQITEESKVGVLAKLEEEKKAYEHDLSGIEAEIGHIQDDLDTSKQHAEDLRAAQTKRDENEDKLADMRGELEVERQRLDAVRQETLNYESKKAKANIAERSIQATKTLLEGVQATCLRLKSELKNMEDGGSKLELLEEAKGVYDRARQQLAEVKEENNVVAKEIDDINGSIRSAEDRLQESKESHDALKDDLHDLLQKAKKAKLRKKGLLYEDGEEPESREFLKAKEAELKKSEEQIESLEKKLQNNNIEQLLSNKKKEHADAVEQARKMELDLDEKASLLPYYEYWVDAFKGEGIRSLAMKDLIPVLNQEMDRIMEYLEGKRARVQFDDDMGLVITDWETGAPTTYRKISGGMKKRVNISIACAFRETIRAASGCDLSLFVVDESADALDTPGKLGFVDLLQDMANDSTIWIITHDKVLREALDEVANGNIHVEMQGGVSRVYITYN